MLTDAYQQRPRSTLPPSSIQPPPFLVSSPFGVGSCSTAVWETTLEMQTRCSSQSDQVARLCLERKWCGGCGRRVQAEHALDQRRQELCRREDRGLGERRTPASAAKINAQRTRRRHPRRPRVQRLLVATCIDVELPTVVTTVPAHARNSAFADARLHCYCQRCHLVDWISCVNFLPYFCCNLLVVFLCFC